MSLVSMLQAVAGAAIRYVVVGGVAARLHGSSRQTDDLDICYDPEPGNVERLTALLASWHAYPRGWEPGLPFFMDARTLRTTPTITLRTRQGDIDLLRRVDPVGEYADHLALPELEAMAVKRGEWPLVG